MAALRGHDEIAARALEFLILTAARTNEVLGAKWSEIDIKGRLWVVPADRMKAGQEHRVPLSAGAVAVLEGIGKQSPITCFRTAAANCRTGQWIGCCAAWAATSITVHGFRAAFRTWAAERTSYPREIIEQCLAHRVGDAVEQAYQRSDQLEKRRRLMSEWSEFCSAPSQPRGEVVPLHATS